MTELHEYYTVSDTESAIDALLLSANIQMSQTAWCFVDLNLQNNDACIIDLNFLFVSRCKALGFAFVT